MKKEHLHIIASNLTAAYASTYLRNKEFEDLRELRYPAEIFEDKLIGERINNIVNLYLRIYDTISERELEKPGSSQDSSVEFLK